MDKERNEDLFLTQEDMDTAIMIIDKAIKERGYIKLIEEVQQEDEEGDIVSIKMPEWLLSLADYFKEKYGNEHVPVILTTVIDTLLGDAIKGSATPVN